jgi:GH15 family glucan-1,4-alpha-glucosidase
VQRRDYGLSAISGRDAVELHANVDLEGRDLKTFASFSVRQGESVPLTLSYHLSHKTPHFVPDHQETLDHTVSAWREWSKRCRFESDNEAWCEAVQRSLITLKLLTYQPTGGIVAALTTSLPEEIGGVRNWDYRYCWVRDATFTLLALMDAGYLDEARAWREWLLRAVAGSPQQLQIMYGVRGERRLTELELPWLDGYENSKPVRIGNAASQQRQLDVYGELLDSLYYAHCAGIETSEPDWRLQSALTEWLEDEWEKPDEGIWEVRGGRKNFTHSKMMAWVAFDRAVRLAEQTKHAGCAEVGRWRKMRDRIHAQVCRRGYNRKVKAFTQFYGSDEMDASILMMPLVGFLPASDERVRNTIQAVERELTQDGFVLRYRPEISSTDGLPGREGAFLPCSFWLASCLHLIHRKDEALELFHRLLSLQNDLGLYAEEYDPRAQRHLGNFPQAFTHVALVNCAQLFSGQTSAAVRQRCGEV